MTCHIVGLSCLCKICICPCNGMPGESSVAALHSIGVLVWPCFPLLAFAATVDLAFILPLRFGLLFCSFPAFSWIKARKLSAARPEDRNCSERMCRTLLLFCLSCFAGFEPFSGTASSSDSSFSPEGLSELLLLVSTSKSEASDWLSSSVSLTTTVFLVLALQCRAALLKYGHHGSAAAAAAFK